MRGFIVRIDGEVEGANEYFEEISTLLFLTGTNDKLSGGRFNLQEINTKKIAY